LLSARDLGQCLPQCLAPSCSAKIREIMTQQLRLLKSEPTPAPVGITDDSRRIRHQNQALGVAENLAGEIAFLLQLGLRPAPAGDVQHQSALVQYIPARIANRRAVHVNVNWPAI